MSEGAFLLSQEMVKEGETRSRRDESEMKMKRGQQTKITEEEDKDSSEGSSREKFMDAGENICPAVQISCKTVRTQPEITI